LLTTNINSNNNVADGDAAYTVSKVSRESHAQTVNFIDGDVPWSYDVVSSPDETTKLSGFSDAQLGEFLSRPVKIREFSWTPGAALSVSRFNPWSAFFANSDVQNKINRYRNLRCDLRIKVLVNGNGFYFGRALLSYNPCVLHDQVTVNRAFIAQDLIQASQKPHILIDPTTSQGGEMLLPFIWHENYLDITKAGWAEDMGEIDIHDFSVLKHANGGNDPITISVFAWAENVTLSVPTTALVQLPGNGEIANDDEPPLHRPYPLTRSDRKGVKEVGFREQGHISDAELDELGFPLPFSEQADGKGQKGMLKASNNSTSDEFGSNGLISKPASAIAKAADALSMIPVLAPYAKATSMLSSNLGDLSKLFGYSRPQVMEDTRSYVPRYLGNLANSDAPEPLVKLSLDSKNELSVDTRVMGLGGQDELAIKSICQRWSYWRSFDWFEIAPAEALLTSIRVAPIYGDIVSGAPATEIHSTALAFGASPFEAWQGSIKFRFNVVCSEYHRGRLRIVYNPVTSPNGDIPYNRVYSTVVDISENRDFEYEVKWADIRAWAKNTGIQSIPDGDFVSDEFPVAAGGSSDNGSISIYVVNELATPSTTQSDVKVQVWVAAGDDFAVAVPTTNNLAELSVFTPQSEVAPEIMATTTDASNSPTSSDEVPAFAAGEGIMEDNQYLVYQGERIVSFRELLRRYQFFNSYWPADFGTEANTRIVSLDLHDFPYFRGWEATGEDTAQGSVGSGGYNFCTMTLLNYLTPAFVGRRGGLRHKYMLSQTRAQPRAVSLSVSRLNIFGTPNSFTGYDMNAALTGARRAAIQQTDKPNLGGSHATCCHVQPSLEFETPYYTYGQRFESARRINRFAQSLPHAHQITVDIPNGTLPEAYRLDRYISIAEDFQLGLFVGAPIMYVYPNPSAV
jgi:hypothetical protein